MCSTCVCYFKSAIWTACLDCVPALLRTCLVMHMSKWRDSVICLYGEDWPGLIRLLALPTSSSSSPPPPSPQKPWLLQRGDYHWSSVLWFDTIVHFRPSFISHAFCSLIFCFLFSLGLSLQCDLHNPLLLPFLHEPRPSLCAPMHRMFVCHVERDCSLWRSRVQDATSSGLNHRDDTVGVQACVSTRVGGSWTLRACWVTKESTKTLI